MNDGFDSRMLDEGLIASRDHGRAMSRSCFARHGIPGRYTGKFSSLAATNVKVRGIPHLAKNERDVGHPWFRGGVRSQRLSLILGGVKSQNHDLFCDKERSKNQFLFRGEKNPKHG